VRVLLLRPRTHERFGLGPFFRVEPLGLEYLGAALEADGHHVEIVDLRLGRLNVRGKQPDLIGISCIHSVDVPETLRLARELKRRFRSAYVMVGGHAAAAAPASLSSPHVDAVGLGAGERSVRELARVIAGGASPSSLPGFAFRGRDLLRASGGGGDVDPTLLPARRLVARHRSGYRCVHRSPIWALETGRGCPFRCAFCAVGRADSYQPRDLASVCRDFESVGRDVFIVDDLFFYPRERSHALARALGASGTRKRWLLAQTRADTVARSPGLLEAWRPLSESFDLFFGFEAATDEELSRLRKDSTIADTEEAVRSARSLGFGVTGNFVVDPDWDETDFERLWGLLERLRLDRVGFTVLTPLPGTSYFEQAKPRLVDGDLGRFDMHHVLWEPKLGRRRFYELMVESWKKNVLASSHAPRRWRKWFRGVGLRDALALAGVLYRTQRLMDVDAYLDDTFPPELPALLTTPVAGE